MYQHWTDPDLLLSQACGLPLVSRLQSSVRLAGTLHYAAPCCRGPEYCSLLIVHEDDPRTQLSDYKAARLAYNGPDSQSGFNALRMALSRQKLPVPFFGDNICSGSHRDSIRLVAKGQADICAVDCVSHALLKRHRPRDLRDTKVLGSTKRTPGLPLITTAKTADETVDALVGAIESVCRDPGLAKVNRDLLITGVSRVDYAAYQRAIRIADPPVTKL